MALAHPFFRHLPSRILLIMTATLLLGLFFSTPAFSQENCKQLLLSRCETCHYITRVCQKVEKEMSKKYWFGGPEGTWKRTIQNMVKQGAVLSDAEEETLVQCLSKPADDVLELCKQTK